MSATLDLANAPLVSQTGVWTWDVAQDSAFTDPVVARLFNITEAEGQEGQPLGRMLEAIHPDDRSQVADNIKQGLAGKPFRERYRVRSKRLGERTVVATGRCFFAPDKKPNFFAGYLIDVSRPIVSDLDLLSIHMAACRDVAKRVDNSAITYLFEALEQEVSLFHRSSGILVA